MLGRLFGRRDASSTSAQATAETTADENAATSSIESKAEEPATPSAESTDEEKANHVFHGVAEMEAITTHWDKKSLIIAYLLYVCTSSPIRSWTEY